LIPTYTMSSLVFLVFFFLYNILCPFLKSYFKLIVIKHIHELGWKTRGIYDS
jgi:hypothetical protein